MKRFDLVIVGGGLVGAGLAIALRNTPLHIALIEAKPFHHEDPRLFALSYSSCQFLHHLGIWPMLEEYATPIRQVHVSRRGYFGALRLSPYELNLPELGQVIPARHIETALHKTLADLKNVTVYQPAKLNTLQQDTEGAELTLTTESGTETLRAAIVIGADGAESIVRAEVNLPTKKLDYQQSAVVTKIKLQRPHQHIAYERFCDRGAIAMLPMTEQTCACIWTADHDTSHQLMAQTDNEFLQSLQQAFGYRLGRLQQTSERHLFPLRMIYAEKTLAGNVLLLGNAAHTLHPIAAQGFNLALYEVATLAESIQAKPSSFTAMDLSAVNTRIQKQQAISIGVSHRLAKLFTHPSSWLALTLQLGMLGLEVTPSLKKQFMQRLIGRTGKIPRLLLGTTHGQ